MQPKNPLTIYKDTQKLETLEEKSDDLCIRIGIFYSKLKTNQKMRFDKVINALSRKYKLYPNKNPLEILLVRQIALNTLRIEEAELELMQGNDVKYSSDIEKWLFLAQKERREALNTLSLLLKVEGKKDKLFKAKDIRDLLREEEGLPPAESQIKSDGHDRRSYDTITRTENEGNQE